MPVYLVSCLRSQSRARASCLRCLRCRRRPMKLPISEEPAAGGVRDGGFEREHVGRGARRSSERRRLPPPFLPWALAKSKAQFIKCRGRMDISRT